MDKKKGSRKERRGGGREKSKRDVKSDYERRGLVGREKITQRGREEEKSKKGVKEKKREANRSENEQKGMKKVEGIKEGIDGR